MALYCNHTFDTGEEEGSEKGARRGEGGKGTLTTITHGHQPIGFLFPDPHAEQPEGGRLVLHRVDSKLTTQALPDPGVVGPWDRLPPDISQRCFVEHYPSRLRGLGYQYGIIVVPFQSEDVVGVAVAGDIGDGHKKRVVSDRVLITPVGKKNDLDAVVGREVQRIWGLESVER